tara:strand:- start:2961 stop:3080 length:120 start_codon:yes stop_codon:yes gene_type:complete
MKIIDWIIIYTEGDAVARMTPVYDMQDWLALTYAEKMYV